MPFASTKSTLEKQKNIGLSNTSLPIAWIGKKACLKKGRILNLKLVEFVE